MKHAMGAVVALALGIGLAVSAQANGTSRQSATPTPNLQSGSTEQMQRSQIRPQRKVAVTRTQRLKGKTHMAKMTRHNRIALAHKQRISKTRMATLHRQKQNQAVGVGSSTPTTGNTGMTTLPPNNTSGNQNLNNTPTQNQ